MSVQGHLLDITVIGCRNLRDTEWISRQDPYVILEYAGNKYRTKTDTDGGRNPTFNEKYMLPLIEGLREVSVAVWNSNTLSPDDFIGSGKILLQKVLTDGYHDNTWPLTTKGGRRAGEIRVILHYTSPKGAHNVTSSGYTHHAPPVHPAPPVYSPYAAPPAYPPSQPSGYAGYPPACAPYPPPSQPPYPPYGAGGYAPPASYGGQPPYPYPPQSYPPQGYPPYPPQGYGGYCLTPSGTHPPQGYGGYGTPPSGTYPPY